MGRSPTSQGIEDRAIRHVATSTLLNHIAEDALQALEVFCPLPDVGNVLFGDALSLQILTLCGQRSNDCGQLKISAPA